MEHYRNRGGDSGVVAYEIGPDSITVMFSDGAVWSYPASVEYLGLVYQASD